MCVTETSAVDKYLDYWFSCVITTQTPEHKPHPNLVLLLAALSSFLQSCSPSLVLFSSTPTGSLISCQPLVSVFLLCLSLCFQICCILTGLCVFNRVVNKNRVCFVLCCCDIVCLSPKYQTRSYLSVKNRCVCVCVFIIGVENCHK